MTALRDEGGSKGIICFIDQEARKLICIDFVYAPASKPGASVSNNTGSSIHVPKPSLFSYPKDDSDTGQQLSVIGHSLQQAQAKNRESSMQVNKYSPKVQRLEFPWELSPSQDLSYLYWLQTPWKSLLDHFVTVTSLSLSPHSSVRQDYCSTLVPIALERPCLLTAILNIAGHNREALGMDQSETDLERLKAISVTSLRQMLVSPTPESEDLALATTLALCVGDIVAGGERPGSWRTHLRGAAAMLDSTDGFMGPGMQKDRMSSLQIFLRRWYLSIEATTLLGSNQLGVPPGYPTALWLSYELCPAFIDELCGFPPYLIRIFGEFTSLASEARQARLTLIESPIDALSLPKVEQASFRRIKHAYELLSEIDQKLRSGAIHPSTESTLTLAHREDFLALNATFHHSAAVHIHSRVLGTPSASPLVQSRVKTIIQLVSTVAFTKDACPAVAFLLPLFTAGSEAISSEDQVIIREYLSKMETTYGMGNVRSVAYRIKAIG